MTMRLEMFPIRVRGARVSFHDGFLDDRDGHAHEGIDIGAPRGTGVVAAASGIVLERWMSGRGEVTGCGWSPRGGNVVLILDPRGYVHYYAHLDQRPTVSPLTSIQAGMPLGAVGNTGAIADGGPFHLHYQVWAVGAGREAEEAQGAFTRRFGRAVNPYAELARLARALGARVGRTGGVLFPESA